MNTPDRAVARKQRRNNNSPYTRKAPKPKEALPTLASSSSFRNLYNFVSSPFRSRAAPPPAEESESEEEGDEEGDESQPIELTDSDEDMENLPATQAVSSWKGKGREVQGSSAGGLTRSSAATNLSLLDPLPNPNSSKWSAASLAPSTHAHALVQMQPTSNTVSKPRYERPMLPPPPPPPPPPRALPRSQTLSSLQPGDSSSSTRAEMILEQALAEGTLNGSLSEEAARELRESIRKIQGSHAPAPPVRSTYTPPLFHPGTSTNRLTTSTSTNTLANSTITRSTSNVSFLSPSRSSVALASSSSSRNLQARASSPGFSSPGKRRPIYLGPGVGNSPSRSRRTVTFGGLDLKPAPVVESPKKRRIEEDVDDEEMNVERKLSGLGGSPAGRGLSTSQSTPSFLSPTPASPASPSAPFTFSIPFSPTTSTSTNNSYSQPAPLSASPAAAPAPPPAPAPSSLKPSQSLSSGLSRYSRNPSLVAPSPLRQSTKFADSPESVKSNGGSPAGSPLVAKGGRSKASSMMLDFIEEEEVGKRAASPAPISNPYQSSGLASPSPRRNPRRSVASESRSSRAGTPKKSVKGAVKQPTALELIEKEAEKDTTMSPTPTSKKQKASSSKANGFSLDASPSTPSRLSSSSASPAPSAEVSTTPTSAPPPKRKAADEAPPSWMTAAKPSPVIFAHDAFGGPVLGSGSKDSTDSDMEGETSTSPAKATLALFKSSADARTTIPEKDFGPKPSFVFDTAAASSPATKKAALPPPSEPLSKAVDKTSFDSPDFDPKAFALATDPVLLPNFTFIFTSITTPLPITAEESAAINEVTALPRSALPKFDLLAPPPPPPATAAAPASTGGFNWASAGLAPPPKPSSDIWTCSTCGTKSPLAKEKCIACEEPRPKSASASSSAPAPASAPVTGGFNWASAGLAPPPKPSADIWTCGVCGTKSPLDKSKCIACEEPRPASVSTASAAPAPATTGGFNWASAGLAPPPKPSADIWTCGVCGTKSPLDKAKCIACEEPQPKPKAVGGGGVGGGGGGFNWGAAGMKKPETQGGWECSVCMIRNGEERTKCASCETERG